MSTSLFYRKQQAREQLAARQAPLANVRHRCQRAAQAWADLAARTERADDARARLEADKLAAAGTADQPGSRG